MARTTNTSGWVGQRVVDSDGEHLGTVEQVYRDQESDEPTWAVVSPGTRFVPLAQASEDKGGLKVRATREQVDQAPHVRDKDRLTPDEEAVLHTHYSREASKPTGSNGTGSKTAAVEAGGGDKAVDGDRDNATGEGPPRAEEVRERQHEEHGGFKWGSVFFGWLVAVAIAALLTGILGAAGAAIGLTQASPSDAQSSGGTIGIVGGVILVLILALAYYAGGYVSGRMSRFDGARQGLGVWLFGLLLTIAAAVAGAVFGSKYNVLSKLDLPRVPVDEGSLATGGLITLAAILAATLIGALLGGKAGERYHKKVDRAGFSQ